MFASLMEWWNSSGSQVQAAIVAALASLLVSVITQFWSPISQRRIERSKIELQAELEIAKTGLQEKLQKELEEIKAKFAKDLESARDSISAKKEAIVTLTDAKNRWSESAKDRPANLGVIFVAEWRTMGTEHFREAYAWLTKHSNECREIFNEIRPLLDEDSTRLLRMKLAEFEGYDLDKNVMSELERYADSPEVVDLARKSMEAKYGFTAMLGICINSTVERLIRSRFSNKSLFAVI